VTVVTAVRPEHVEALAALAEEMDRFYGATELEPLDLRLKQTNDALFANPPSAHALLAWNDSQAVGFASYSFLWPAVGLTRSLFLKELYVIESARRTGVGKLMMQSLAEIAITHGCSRLEWQTDHPNRDAQDFYAQLGVPVDDSKLFYRAQGEALRDLASGR
jgi:GNAT superfamily N-acetyltransferase